MKISVLAAAAVLLCSGCASVMNDSTHPVRIETRTEAGELISNAECKLSNDYGSVSAKSGETTPVRRSAKDLDISCKAPNQPEASGRAISRANSGMWGNILIGGGIGALIDHNKGTAYTYPTWVQLVFGKLMVFDRSAEKQGQPTPGIEVGGTPAQAAPTPTDKAKS
ncbi:hypothetical protein [Pelomonas sp. SE-A7]|uniref:hypothetical protein n=1 Tax=Pelomonas sp. SE-A7 TaxID=3054953 RepID=UPI00259CDDED|nr:hypothetical protein [Pelomonas sp. SE-A7]MDM4766173.1 hypothetical protein [Pelomonas sp. SE-A7]